MQKQVSLRETKQHGAVRFPFNIYPCTIPGDFPQVALHWQESMELIFVSGSRLVQAGAVTHPAYMGYFHFYTGYAPCTQADRGQYMEYENIILIRNFWVVQEICVPKSIFFRCKAGVWH